MHLSIMGKVGKIELLNDDGQRKYLNARERERYRLATESYPELEKLFFLMFFWTGARITEVLNLKIGSIDLTGNLVIIRCLKKRSPKPVYRRIPLPPDYLYSLENHFGLTPNLTSNEAKNDLLWHWSRATASRRIHSIMLKADIQGPQACARGCRHSFGLACAQKNIPASVLQKWMGHEEIATTMIYMDFVMEDQRVFAERLWGIKV